MAEQIALSKQFLLRWNRAFYWIFIASYTLSTAAFALTHHDLGWSEIFRLVTIMTAGGVLAASYYSEKVYNSLYKYTYFIVYMILVNTTVLAYNNVESPMAMVYYGSSMLILTYMYLDKWYLVAYEAFAILSAIMVYYKAYGDDPVKWISGVLVQALLLVYVTVFFHTKKLSDDELHATIHRLTDERDSLAIGSTRMIELHHMYKSIVDVAPYQIATLDVTGKYMYVNHIAVINEQMRNWIIGKSDKELFEKMGLPQGRADIRLAAINKCIETRTEVMVTNDNGEDGIKIPFSSNKVYVPVPGQDGEIVRVVIYG